MFCCRDTLNLLFNDTSTKIEHTAELAKLSRPVHSAKPKSELHHSLLRVKH